MSNPNRDIFAHLDLPDPDTLPEFPYRQYRTMVELDFTMTEEEREYRRTRSVFQALRRRFEGYMICCQLAPQGRRRYPASDGEESNESDEDDESHRPCGRCTTREIYNHYLTCPFHGHRHRRRRRRRGSNQEAQQDHQILEALMQEGEERASFQPERLGHFTHEDIVRWTEVLEDHSRGPNAMDWGSIEVRINPDNVRDGIGRTREIRDEGQDAIGLNDVDGAIGGAEDEGPEASSRTSDA